MTLTAMIEDELLDAVREPGGLERVMQRHRGSKGPLYNALSSAMGVMGQRLEQAHLEKTETEARWQKLQECIAPLQERRDRLLEEVQELDRRHSEAEMRLTEMEGLQERTQELGKRGFGEEELDRLSDLLAQIAADQGAPPEEGVAQFFRIVGRFERIVGLDLEATRAESRATTDQVEAARWESEAKGAETRSKARVEAINLLEELLEQGVKGDDLSNWTRVLGQTGVTLEKLTESLSQYGSVEASTKACQERANGF